MFRTSKTEGSLPSSGPKVRGDNVGGGEGAEGEGEGEGGIFLTCLEDRGEDRVR